jgi:hypothetical protein
MTRSLATLRNPPLDFSRYDAGSISDSSSQGICSLFKWQRCWLQDTFQLDDDSLLLCCPCWWRTHRIPCQRTKHLAEQRLRLPLLGGRLLNRHRVARVPETAFQHKTASECRIRLQSFPPNRVGVHGVGSRKWSGRTSHSEFQRPKEGGTLSRRCALLELGVSAIVSAGCSSLRLLAGREDYVHGTTRTSIREIEEFIFNTFFQGTMGC